METRDQARKEEEVMEDPLGVRVEKLENKIAEQNQKLDKSFAQLIDTIRLISVKVNNASSSGHLQQQRSRETVYPSSEVVHGRIAGLNSNYSAVTRSSKLDFHRFSGDRVRDWLFKLEQFFSLDFTPEELKVSIASTLCDGVAAKWHKSLFESDFGIKLLSNWNMYKLLLEEQFTEVLDDPIDELKQLKETNGIEEYHKKFELLRARAKLSEEILVSAYLDGLRLDTQTHIKMFQPQPIQQCLLVGRLYETAHPKKVIIRKESDDYPKGAQHVSDLVENEVKKVKKYLVEIVDAMSSDDDQNSDAGDVFGFNVEAANTESSNQERLELHTTNNGCLDHFESLVLMKEKPESVNINEVKLATHIWKLKPDLIQAKMMLPYFVINIPEVAGTAEKFQELPTITNKSYAFQLLGKMSLHQASQNVKKKRKASKSWMFKYKNQERGIKSLHNQVTYFATLCDRESDWLRNAQKSKPYYNLEWNISRVVSLAEFAQQNKSFKSWMFQFKDEDVREEWFHFTSRVTIQKDPCLYLLLVAAETWCTQTHFGDASYHVWHRWKARYLQSFNNRVWDPGGSVFRDSSFKLKLQ